MRDDAETEILLGNKQLVGIFFVVAILLGAAFTGGYMLGRGASAKKPFASAPASANTTAPSPPTVGETHAFPADSGAASDVSSSTPPEPASKRSAKRPDNSQVSEDAPLGTPHRKADKVRAVESQDTATGTGESFTPQSGQQFLQVAAVERDEAEAVADVLHKKGFRAHAVPKPGNAKLYRVIIGPIRDAGDLSNTRDALRRTGFREVIVQRY